MTAIIIIAALATTPVLILVTLVQILYMDSVRLRARELPFLELFRQNISDRIGLKPDDGILTFSLIKHTVLVLSGVSALAISGSPDVNWIAFGEAVALSMAGMLLFTYIAPQLLYRRTTGRWLLPFVPALRVLSIAFRPITGLLAFLQSLSELGDANDNKEEASTPEEGIDALISAGAEEGILEEDDRKLIHSVVAFGDKTVREVMTARPAIVTIGEDATLEELRQLVIHEQFSRIPVYCGDIDNIIGFVHVRDMFELDHTERNVRKVGELARDLPSVPETKRVGDLMREMQQNGTHMAVVVDEYGGTAGLVTMEDLVEEIVGEIRDEHEPGSDVEPDSDGGYIVSGSFDVDHLAELLQFRPPEHTESTTVGGLATEWAGHVPASGEIIEHDGIRIEVLSSNELRVDQVRISRAPEVETNGNNGRKD